MANFTNWNTTNTSRLERLPKNAGLPSACYINCNNAYLEGRDIVIKPQLCNQLDLVRFAEDCRMCLRMKVTEINPYEVDEIFGDLIYFHCHRVRRDDVSDGVSFSDIGDVTSPAPDSRTTFQATKTVDGVPSTILVTLNPTADTPPNTDASGYTKSPSRAWIAGPVVGRIAGVIIVAGPVWLWLRRRKSHDRMQEGGDVQAETRPELDSHGKSELHSDSVPAELHGN